MNVPPSIFMLFVSPIGQPGQRSRYSDWRTGWTVRTSNPDRVNRLSSQKRLGRLWGPPSYLFNGDRGYFPGSKRPGREVNEWSYTSSPFVRFCGVDKGSVSPTHNTSVNVGVN